jgi:hypothetical protein
MKYTLAFFGAVILLFAYLIIANGGSLMGAILLVLLIAFYFLPTIVACCRDHRQVAAISIINVFLGWTLAGWVVSLAWAFTTDVQPPRSEIAEAS